MPSASAALLFVLGVPPLLEEAEQHAAAAAQLAAITEAAAGQRATDDPGDAYATLPRDAEGVPVVTDLAQLTTLAPETIIPERRTWIRHRVRPRERVTQIAARYGVSTRDIFEHNRLDPNREFPRGYWRLRIHAHRIPPPRVKVRYVAQADESWGDIAAKFRVEQPDLRAWNWQRRRLAPGRTVTLWVDPGAPQTIHPGAGPEIPDAFEIPQGATSKGYPDRGRLLGGVMLPESPLYTKRVPDNGLYGSTHTIALLTEAFAAFRHDTGYEGEVVIGAISRRRGGRFHPHKSHQSGRDVDIRLPRLPGVPRDAPEPNPDEVDWHATWGLIRALTGTGQVGRIFLEAGLHRRLYEAARQLGESREAIAEILPWPSWTSKRDPVVRHSRGHDGHIHVRFKCGADEPKCRSRSRRRR